nr:murein biosynthesis integral membrane protein MurJ [Bacillus sp. REN10]
MKKIAILLMVITILSKLLGLLRDIVLSYFYGTSAISDAYLIAITISAIVFGFVVSGISTGYIPLFRKIEKEQGLEEGNKFTNNLVNMLLLLSTFIIGFGLLFTEQLVKIFASGFEGETLSLAVTFTRISLISIYFTGLFTLFSGYLQLHGNYVIPALTGLPLNFITILSIYFSSITTPSVLVIGLVAATASQLVLLIPFIYKSRYKHKLTLNFKDKHIQSLFYISIPVIIGSSVDQINVLVDRTIASQLSVGGISALNYGNRLVGFVQGIFVLSISTVMYPLISKMAAENDIKGLKKTVVEAIGSINLLVIPATVGALLFAEPLVTLLFGRGAFDDEALTMTSGAFFFYSIGMIGVGIREILDKAFYSLQDSRAPMVNAVIALVLNIILNIILSRFLGIEGLALATSISAVTCTILLLVSLRKKIGPLGLKQLALSFIKISVASVFMGGIAKLTYIYLLNILSVYFSVVIAIAVGVVAYFIIIFFMRIEEVDVVLHTLRTKIKKSV